MKYVANHDELMLSNLSISSSHRNYFDRDLLKVNLHIAGTTIKKDFIYLKKSELGYYIINVEYVTP